VGVQVDHLIPMVEPSPGNEPWLQLVTRSSTAGLVPEVALAAGGLCESDVLDPVRRDLFSAAAAAHVLRTRRPHLLLVSLVEADWIRHARGPHGPGVEEALRRLDDRVGEVVSAARDAGILPRTAFVVTGDHGHRDVHTALLPNAVLRRHGLIQTGPGDEVRSWRAIGQRGGIHLADPSDPQAASQVRQLFRELAEAHPGTFRLVERAELDARGADPSALLYLEPAEGYLVGDRLTGNTFLEPAPVKGHAGIRTGLLLSGAGVRPGAPLALVRQVDLAPTVAQLLGFSMPGAEGRPLTEAFVEHGRL
jgi:hypothetical protein